MELWKTYSSSVVPSDLDVAPSFSSAVSGSIPVNPEYVPVALQCQTVRYAFGSLFFDE
jgi:hypothetical protein